jgi:surfactin synthase thioesterase subunit
MIRGILRLIFGTAEDWAKTERQMQQWKAEQQNRERTGNSPYGNNLYVDAQHNENMRRLEQEHQTHYPG